MMSQKRSWFGKIARSALLACVAAGALACFSQADGAGEARLTAASLDAVDTALAELAEGRWPEWSMRVEAGRLVFEVDVAETPVASVCREIGAAVRRSVGGGVAWSAELSRSGAFLSRCGTFDMAAAAGPKRG